MTAPLPPATIAPPAITACLRAGAWHVDAATALGPYPARLLDRLVAGAHAHPARTLLAERGADGRWVNLSYAGALDAARRIGQALRQRGLSAERPLVILADNSLAHAQLALGALYAGVAYAPIAPAHLLATNDHTRLRHMLAQLTPGAIYADPGAQGTLATLLPPGCEAIAQLACLLASAPGDIDQVHAAQDGDTIAKLLFTSGSTGTGAPKAVITTQRMLCSNQQMLRQTFPALATTPPVLVDWLPWSHTFGGSHNVGLALYNGGTLYIDAGKPAPGAIGATLANLAEIAPTMHFNVPRGWDLLASALERDAALRARFFSRVTLLFCAGAPLAPATWQRLRALAASAPAPVRIMSGLGMTETAPGCLFGTGAVDDAHYVGLPAPGCRVKLVPAQGKLEACFAGPHVTPGYWRDRARSAAAFDADGYYRTGDALRLAEPGNPAAGFLFDGRLAEDFKLDSGTWVGTGALRARVAALGAPCVLDAVPAGSGRGEIALLLFAHMAACRALAGLPDAADAAAVLASTAVRAHFTDLLARLNGAAGAGSATRVARLLLLADGPAAAHGELTDKGSLNQAAVLAHRAALVEAMYAGTAPGLILAP